ncbi:hypothetical protein PR048_005188 [Dryococelus australis]|uniref:Uncharacterized protein n=1 Tax=Dryococelus australis TaxID=614101 RepID=A0ABQ9I7I4_9NEOP|nr:hypothetical protein PR048_005188 [Dryococelus australis]
MDVKMVILISCIRRRRLNKNKKACLWVYPFVRDRSAYVLFVALYSDLRKMSVSSFDEFLKLCKNYLERRNTVLREAISPEQKLFG